MIKSILKGMKKFINIEILFLINNIWLYVPILNEK